jgi:hypothetical protein
VARFSAPWSCCRGYEVGLHIQRVVTSGIFSLDGEDFEVDNNV